MRPLAMAMEWCWLLIHQSGRGNALSGNPILAKLDEMKEKLK